MRLEIDGISESDTGISTTYDSDPAKLHCCPLNNRTKKKNVVEVVVFAPQACVQKLLSRLKKENKLSDGPIVQFLVSDG